MNVDVLFFEIRSRRCALPVSAVREVVKSAAVTPVPLAPATLRGICPVHGQVLPLLDVGGLLAPGSEHGSLARWDAERIVVIEAKSATDPTPVRAALAVGRVSRLGTINDEHSRPPPPGPPFVIATVLDVEGPALLLDPAGAIDAARDLLKQAVLS